MKNIITLIAVACTVNFLQAQVTVDWNNYPGGVAITTNNYNDVYTVGWDYNPAGDITLTKRDSAGNILWDTSFNNTDNTRHEVATWVECDHAGDILVSGTIRSGFSNPVNASSLLMKFNASGLLLWRVVYESSFDGSSTTKLLVDASNNIYVLGVGTGPSGMVTKVKKFDALGNAVWSYFDSAGIGRPVNFKFTPDSCIILSARPTTGNFMGFAKIDLNGNNIWNLAGVNSFTIGDASGDAAGNTYVVHGSGIGSTIKKIASNGNVLWSTAYNFLNAFRIEVGTDNFPVAVGFPIPGAGGSGFLKTDSNGTQLWYNSNADSIHNFLSHAQIKIDQYNNIYLAASILSAQGVCKVNSNGTSAWAATFPTGTSAAFCIGNDYNVYVVGGTTTKLGQSLITTIAEQNQINNIKMYPNPASSIVTVTFSLMGMQAISVLITDMMGRTIKNIKENNFQEGNNNISVDVSELNSGFYLTKIKSAESIQTIKLLKN